MATEGWTVALDRGGTFTDLVAHGPRGQVITAKTLATPGRELAAVSDLLPAGASVNLRVGTTVATNALLTRRVARVALLTSHGLRDVPWIGHQARPNLFSLDVSREPSLAEWVVELDQRVRWDGTVERELRPALVRDRLQELRGEGCSVVVVALAHAVRYPEHERAVGVIAASLGFEQIVMSHEVLPREGLVDRTQAALVDGCITPEVARFVARVSASVSATHVVFMGSRGGLVCGGDFRGRNALLSGPAGGVAACARLAREYGLGAVLGFDMGGTSTDVCRWAGDIEIAEGFEMGGQHIPLPAVDVVSVAAGGGSRLQILDGVSRVGPESVGAVPGPACYRMGDGAAVTDANLVLGRIQARWFPAVFGADGDQRLDRSAAWSAVASAAGVSEDDERAVLDAAAGFLAVSNRAMADAIAQVSVSRGHDPREHVLVAMGGAGAQHACAVAELLGMRRVVVHPRAGVLSAWGIAAAERTAQEEAPVQRVWSPALRKELQGLRGDLAARARSRVSGPVLRPIDLREQWLMRYVGSTHAMFADDRRDFEDRHARLFGLRREGSDIEVLTLRVTARTAQEVTTRCAPTVRQPVPLVLDSAAVHHTLEGERTLHEAPVVDWTALGGGDEIRGPALIVGGETTVVVDPGWSALVWEDGLLDLTRQGSERVIAALPSRPDPFGLALYSRRFMAIAERMGATLARVAWSTNIKERRDFSCAVFTAEGSLLANAPHIPVHLGAMGETLRALIAGLPPDAIRPGRAWASNDPRHGGSHLPDITVMSPVFVPGAAAPSAWVCSRGHHADVGGTTPGSMPPFSTSLAEEGVVLGALLLVDGGRWREHAIADVLGSGPYPVRDAATVFADLKAQVAANHVGLTALVELYTHRGSEVVDRWAGWVLDHGNAVLRAWLRLQPRDLGRCADRLDDGTPVVVALTRTGAGASTRLIVDFDGTGAASEGNLNAPRAVVRAAVLYVLRCAIGRDIPLNEGVLTSVEVRIPAGSLLDPGPGAAVVAGNVETSQRVVDVLLGALGLAAASQGTMNNLTFGTAEGSYYETLAGGAGATAQGPGASGVQTHMTNTRITDVEVLESRHPVLVWRFARRAGSGGAGRNRGGDGLERTLRFLAPVQVSLLSQRRESAPFGLDRGEPGARGGAVLLRDGVEETLPGCFVRSLRTGDELTVATPGGGGFGAPPHDAEEV